MSRHAPSAPRPEPNRTILLVDDDRGLVDVLRRLFAHRGWRVFVATSGAELLVLLAELQPSDVSFVLLDLQLGDASGFDLLPKIVLRFPNAPVVALSGVYTTTKQRADALRLGACNHLEKPHPTTAILTEAEFRAEAARIDETLPNESGQRRIQTSSTIEPYPVALFGSGSAWIEKWREALRWSITRHADGPALLDIAPSSALLVFAPTAAELARAQALLTTLRKLEPDVPVLFLLEHPTDSKVILDAYSRGATFVMRQPGPPEKIGALTQLAVGLARAVAPSSSSRASPSSSSRASVPPSLTPTPPSTVRIGERSVELSTPIVLSGSSLLFADLSACGMTPAPGLSLLLSPNDDTLAAVCEREQGAPVLVLSERRIDAQFASAITHPPLVDAARALLGDAVLNPSDARDSVPPSSASAPPCSRALVAGERRIENGYVYSLNHVPRKLIPTDLNLLSYLLANIGRVVPYDELLENVVGLKVSPSAWYQRMSSLRGALGDDHHLIVVTKHRVGCGIGVAHLVAHRDRRSEI